MKIAIGSDHAGPIHKAELIKWLESMGHEVIDKGTDSNDSVDYPDFAYEVADSVAQGRAEKGIIICGSGIGVSITANKVEGIRAALVYNEETAQLARQHNDANVMCYGARFFSVEDAKKMVSAFFNTDFKGGRHQRRVDKIHDLTGC